MSGAHSSSSVAWGARTGVCMKGRVLCVCVCVWCVWCVCVCVCVCVCGCMCVCMCVCQERLPAAALHGGLGQVCE